MKGESFPSKREAECYLVLNVGDVGKSDETKLESKNRSQATGHGGGGGGYVQCAGWVAYV